MLFQDQSDVWTMERGALPWWIVGESPALSRVVAELVACKQRANRRQNYVDELERVLNLFAKEVGALPISEVGPSDIESFLAPYSVATRATMLLKVSVLFYYAERMGYLQHNPMPRIERPIIELKAPAIMKPDEAKAMLGIVLASHPTMLLYIVLALFAGIRPCELDRMKTDDVDRHRKVVRVDAAASKIRSRRFVQLEPAACAWLDICDMAAGKPISPLNKPGKLRLIAHSIGWEHWPHDICRHTAASYLLALYGDAGRVATRMGHTVGVLMRHYAELVSAEDCAAFWAIRPES